MTDALVLGLGALAVLVFLIAIRIPIAYAMILVGGVGTMMLNGPALVLSQLKTLAYGQFSIYDLSVVPMFVLMGAIASKTGLSQALFRGANAWLGWMRGGTAMAAIAGCAGFGAVCGSSLATASTMGKVALPELRRYNYSGALATGTLAAGGVLGILIPPSVVLIIYAVIVEANIVTMFMAAFLPGLLAVILFLLTIAIYVAINPSSGPKGGVADRGEFVEATIGMIPVLVIFGLVIGGIYGGLYNPTPAAAVGVFLVLFFGVVQKNLSRSDFVSALKETAATSGMIYLIILGAELLKIFMSRVGLPQETAAWISNSGLEPMTVLIILLVALIILGCLMDSLSMILLVIPFFWPVLVDINGGIYQGADGAGFGMSTEDLKIWFGILALIVVELGLITPPVGMNVFVISSLARDTPMIETFKGVAPFFGAEVIRVILLVSFPAIALWLPEILR
ncbi:MAG: TRAP transporter large permease [Roseibium album]|uniref:TRAP transporter large permease protein n=1 Tax=Roseibium album TaxID=311410 RepID=A0A0M7AK19_9HYPH|nr:TRAP transporter large permease [Roseibium album]MBG6158687.1 tripartite ATP-independent transporter DctM subunit [Labrenzia sp. EL_162]MBG6160474.1 tripartite ATP-independent transporter DctM subunit [Labrenzia sp. EL_195]MBG6197221.1 tripartite ATP-independent transporter DctM subunit [Labrenzia sp. EL_159]MBG6203833.1 tripartite ATP-independent transporter DctM subunit [Labrenzia sp. EL_13]CTQ60480.1 Neu5Ac permease [Roseibium album]